jgi:LysR family glycine cleavage system transcriptional activator
MATAKKRLPPLNTIAAFEASARLRSFTLAAKELNLSQGAVSRQIQVLEERLGVDLFIRRHKEIELTKAGVIFQQAIAQSLMSIRRAVSVIENLEKTGVTIAASVAMSSFWLMPLLIDFRDQHPDIDIRILASDQSVDPRREAIDLAIHYGDGHWPGLVKHKLFDEEIFPVCSPDYLKGRTLTSAADLLDEVLIDVETGLSVCSTWEKWLDLAGVECGQPSSSIRVTNFDLAYRAASAGKGIALAWSYGANDFLREGRLIRPISQTVRTHLSEYIVTAENYPLTLAAKYVLDALLAYANNTSNDFMNAA